VASAPDGERRRTPTARSAISTVCHHLALVAIDGATDEVALTLDASFRLHIDRTVTDRWGYLALIAANHAAHGTRPPLDVTTAQICGEYVMASLEPRCLAYFRLAGEFIAELWITVDWNEWTNGVWAGE
jgi:hypothetical protein